MLVFGLLLGLIGLPAIAFDEITTQVHDIDYGENKNDEVLVFLANGIVTKVHTSHRLLSHDFLKSDVRKNWYTFTLDEQRFITSVKLARAEDEVESLKNISLAEAPMSYVPTTVASIKIAKDYHREARYKPKDSQCFNRALIWCYEWWKNHSLKSNKLLIYFTRNYIRRYDFEWWFHIAPYVHVMEDGKVVERVLDVKYTNGPMEFQKWANIFLRNDAPCAVITKYSEYADSPYTGECFFQRTHMYTYQPADLQMYEAWGYQKNSFNINEVRGAYLEAFDENH